VGQTKRYLKTRINEHVKNIKAEESKLSVVSKHMLECNHIFDWKNVRILDFEQNYYKRYISEMIHIKTQKTVQIRLIIILNVWIPLILICLPKYLTKKQ